MSMEDEIVKNNMRILLKLVDTPENRETCFKALKQSINDFQAGRSLEKSGALMANKFMLKIIGDQYDDWFKVFDVDGSVEAYLDSPQQRGYIKELVKTFGKDYYNDVLFYQRFKDALNQFKSYNEDTGSDDIIDEDDTDISDDTIDEDDTDILGDTDGGDDLETPDEDTSEDEEIDFNEDIDFLDTDISMYVDAIIQRVKATCESCFQLDSAIGLMLPNGILRLVLQKNVFKQDRLPSPLMADVYKRILQCVSPSGFRCVNSSTARVTPAEMDAGYTYYPGEVLGYALGIINGKKYSSWDSFEEVFRELLNTKFNEYLEKGILSEYAEKIVNGLSTILLVLMYKEGTGMRIRVSLPGYTLDVQKFENSIRSKSTFSNAAIIVNNIAGTRDTYDIQIMQDLGKYLSEPTWGYQAFEAYTRNGKKPNIYDGLPMGRKLNGEIVEFKVDPSDRFLYFLAAGSGSGKGVLTLSILASCLGSGIPVFYVDQKPDMAEIFWEMSEKYGVKSFVFDGSKPDHPYGYLATDGIPEHLRGTFGKVATRLVYLKCLEWALILAKYRAVNGITEPNLFFVFDECEAAQKNIVSGLLDTLVSIIKDPDHSKANGGDGSPEYQYAKKLANWVVGLDTMLKEFNVTNARKSAVYSLFIGQDTTVDNWQTGRINGKDISLFSQQLKTGSVFKYLGKGTLGPYGTQNAKITPEERQCITEHRFFLQSKGPQPKDNVDVFKTFLTLNTDDPDARCWVNGIGNKLLRQANNDTEEYHRLMAKKYPGHGKYTNQYGIHTGVGFEGLASMYCDGDKDTIAHALSSSWTYSQLVMQDLGMTKRYEDIGEFIYDFSIEGLFSVDDALTFDTYLSGLEEASTTEDDDFDFTVDDDDVEREITFDEVPDMDDSDDFTDDDFTDDNYTPEDFLDSDTYDDIEPLDNAFYDSDSWETSGGNTQESDDEIDLFGDGGNEDLEDFVTDHSEDEDSFFDFDTSDTPDEDEEYDPYGYDTEAFDTEDGYATDNPEDTVNDDIIDDMPDMDASLDMPEPVNRPPALPVDEVMQTLAAQQNLIKDMKEQMQAQQDGYERTLKLLLQEIQELKKMRG